jgi:hypothetical protein
MTTEVRIDLLGFLMVGMDALVLGFQQII